MPSNKLAKKPNRNKMRLPETMPEGTRCVKVYIPDNIEYVGYLLGAIGRLSQQVWYDRDAAHTAKDVALLWNKANQQTMASLADGCDGSEVETIEKITTEYISSIIEIEAEMGRLTIEKTENGVFLVDDCGCGHLERYALTPAAYNPETGGISTGIDIIPAGTPIPSPAEQLECYYEAAADVIVGSIQSYVDGVQGWLISGVYNASGAVAGIEIAQWISAVVNGNIDINFSSLGYTATEIKNAIVTQGLRDVIATRLADRNLSGQLSRWNVVNLMLFAPVSVEFPTPVLFMANSWASYVNLAELNTALDLAAAQCKGYSLPDSFPTIGYLEDYYTWMHIWDFRTEKLVDNAGFTYDDEEDVYWEWAEGIGYRGLPVADSPSYNRFKSFFNRASGGTDPLVCWLDYSLEVDQASAYIDHLIGDTDFGKTDWEGVRMIDTPGVDVDKFWLHIEADDANVGESGGGVSGSIVIRRMAVAGNGTDFFSDVATE